MLCAYCSQITDLDDEDVNLMYCYVHNHHLADSVNLYIMYKQELVKMAEEHAKNIDLTPSADVSSAVEIVINQ